MHNHKGFTYALLVVIGLCLSPVFAFAEEASGEHVQPHVALVFGSSTTAQDDASFITAVTNGTREAAKACDMAVDIYTQDDKKPFIFLRRVMTEHPDVVIAVNFQKVEPLIESIEANPNTKFIVIDGVIPPFFTNAKSIIFREHEGSFL
ncbi:MAG: BMP family ABC transporter substrate-binding protein, partial [Rickettsiales bacterium]